MKNTAVVAAMAGMALPASARIVARQETVDPAVAACQSQAPCWTVENIETDCNTREGAAHQSCMCSEKPFFSNWRECRSCIFANKPDELAGWINVLDTASSSLCNAATPTAKFQDIFASLPGPATQDAAAPTASSATTAASSSAASSSSPAARLSPASSVVGAVAASSSSASSTATSAGTTVASTAATSAQTSAFTSASHATTTSAVRTISRTNSSGLTSTAPRTTELSSGASFNAAATSILALAVAGAAFMVL